MKRLGFVIANELEEYLSSFYETSDSIHTCWLKIDHPNRLHSQLIKVFPTKKKALLSFKKIHTTHKLWVMSLYETANQFVVSTSGDDVPSWIENIN